MLRRTGAVLAAIALALLGVAGVATWRYVQRLDALVQEKLSGRRWDFPSKIYADTTLIHPGADLAALGVLERLIRLEYRPVSGPVVRPGEFHQDDAQHTLDLFLRAHIDPSGPQPPLAVHIELSGSIIQRLVNTETGSDLTSVQIEPELLAGLYQDVWQERRLVTLDQLPALLINTILSTEDQRFFEHRGIDPSGVARAIWVNLTRGRVVQGGSTLTQQLMKNFFLSEERTLRRKVREAAMALIAERRYSKREILEDYLNEIYLGQNGAQGVFGVWEASRFYFRREPVALTLPECALLAGIIKAPNYYSPFQHPDRALKRRNDILRLMQKNALIPEGELQAALAEPLGVVPQRQERLTAPYFTDFMRQELAASYPSEVLTREGLSIFTGLDTQLQRIAEQVLQSGLAELEAKHPRLKREPHLQGCLIALDPRTGEVKAMMGGRDYRSTQFNRAVQAFRQPGSIFKPFTYAAAIASGRVSPTSLIEDAPFTWTYGDQSWSPVNYKQSYHGTVTVQDALAFSLNAATARLAQQIGLRSIRDIAQRMGITSDLPLYPSMVLGAVEVTPLEVAQAYATFANGGTRATPLAVQSVVDHDGQVIERNPVEIEQAISPETAYVVTTMMQGVLDRGTGHGARRRGFTRPAAGKTGTTNDYKDAWFAGFTPDLLAVVWVGFDDGHPVGLAGGEAALPIWTDFMKRATAGQPERAFIPPPGVRAPGQPSDAEAPDQPEPPGEPVPANPDVAPAALD